MTHSEPWQQGFLGSCYYVTDPLRNLAGTVAVNLDMIAGPERPNEIQLVGGSLSPDFSCGSTTGS